MRAIRATLTGVMILGLLLTLAALQGTASAQPYPPPVGSLSAEATPSPAAIGTTTTVTGTVLDSSGNPVPDAEVLFQIDSQPGTGAQFSNGETQITATSDANGVATAILSVGNTAGNIIVTLISGEKTSQVTVQVQSPAAVPPTGGQPTSEDEGGLAAWQAALIAAGVAILLSGGVIALRRRRA